MEHPNLNVSDRNTMETYCKIFDLDWRGDRSYANKEEWLYTHPVYVDAKDKSRLHMSLDDKVVRQMLREAGREYLGGLTAKIMAE